MKTDFKGALKLVWKQIKNTFGRNYYANDNY